MCVEWEDIHPSATTINTLTGASLTRFANGSFRVISIEGACRKTIPYNTIHFSRFDHPSKEGGLFLAHKYII